MDAPINPFSDYGKPSDAPREKADLAKIRVAVLIPCYNEELTITNVVNDFRAELPQADICVFDNNSVDHTTDAALRAGANVYREKRQGKGFTVQSMFRDVDADIYVMVDGDGTYPASLVHELIAPIARGEADVVIGSRLHEQCVSNFNFWHRLGNKFFLLLLKLAFQARLTDMLSGYRAFSREFVKRVPIFGGGFEIETELTIKALQRGYRIVEIPAHLGERPSGSVSKIRILRDGIIILNTMVALFRDYKPLTFFGLLGAILMALGAVLSVTVVKEFLSTGLIARVPRAIMALGLILAGMLSGTVGFIVHTITRRFQELDHQLRLMVNELADGKNTPNTLRIEKRKQP